MNSNRGNHGGYNPYQQRHGPAGRNPSMMAKAGVIKKKFKPDTREEVKNETRDSTFQGPPEDNVWEIGADKILELENAEKGTTGFVPNPQPPTAAMTPNGAQ